MLTGTYVGNGKNVQNRVFSKYVLRIAVEVVRLSKRGVKQSMTLFSGSLNKLSSCQKGRSGNPWQTGMDHEGHTNRTNKQGSFRMHSVDLSKQKTDLVEANKVPIHVVVERLNVASKLLRLDRELRHTIKFSEKPLAYTFVVRQIYLRLQGFPYY